MTPLFGPERFGHWYGEDEKAERCFYCHEWRRPLIERVWSKPFALYNVIAGVSITLWIVLLALLALLCLPGCFNAEEQGRLERAREQAQTERQVAAEQFQRGEIDADAYHNLLDQADQVESDARAQAIADSSSRWISDVFDPPSLIRDLVLVALGVGVHHRVRNKSRAKALAALSVTS